MEDLTQELRLAMVTSMSGVSITEEMIKDLEEHFKEERRLINKRHALHLDVYVKYGDEEICL